MIELKENLEEEYGAALIDIEEWKVFNDSRNLLERSGKQRLDREFDRMISWLPLRTRWWILDRVRPSQYGNYVERSIWRYMNITGSLHPKKTDVDDLVNQVHHLMKLNPNVPQNVKDRL